MTRDELKKENGGELPAEYWRCLRASLGCGQYYMERQRCLCGTMTIGCVRPEKLDVQEALMPLEAAPNPCRAVPRAECPRIYTGDKNLSCLCGKCVKPE